MQVAIFKTLDQMTDAASSVGADSERRKVENGAIARVLLGRNEGSMNQDLQIVILGVEQRRLDEPLVIGLVGVIAEVGWNCVEPVVECRVNLGDKPFVPLLRVDAEASFGLVQRIDRLERTSDNLVEAKRAEESADKRRLTRRLLGERFSFRSVEKDTRRRSRWAARRRCPRPEA